MESKVGYCVGRPSTAIGLMRGSLIAGVAYTHYHEGGSISASIAGEGYWCTRAFLKPIFRYPFVQMKVRRITCYIESGNEKSKALCEHLGFTYESTMERATPRGDVWIYRLFREDCRWI